MILMTPFVLASTAADLPRNLHDRVASHEPSRTPALTFHENPNNTEGGKRDHDRRINRCYLGMYQVLSANTDKL